MHPFLRLDSASEADMLADAAHHVLLERGVARFSVRALARWIGVTGPALTQRWGGEVGARTRILRLAVSAYGARWLLWSRGPLIKDDPSLSLPLCAEEIDGVRVWLSLEELARSEHAAGDPVLATMTAQVRAEERAEVRHMVRSADGEPISATAATAICALAAGLRAELIAPDPALDAAPAALLLRATIAAAREGTMPGGLLTG